MQLSFLEAIISDGFSVPHPGCNKSYTQKHGLKEYLKSAHDIVDSNSFTTNVQCPFNCGIKAYRTTMQGTVKSL